MRLVFCCSLLVLSFVGNSQILWKKKKKKITYENIILTDASTQHLVKALQFQTVSKKDSAIFYNNEFKKFKSFLKESYPNVFQTCTEIQFKSKAICLKWEGSDPSLKPILFMAHQDVVPAIHEKAKWKFAPFGGQISEGKIYGRGALDNKSSLIGLFEATEYAIKNQFIPKRTTYFVFGDDEETDGNGAKEIAKWCMQNKITFELILDEGPGVALNLIEEVNKPIALIGIAEKGYATAELTVDQESGHSSMPTKRTAIGQLSQAIANIEKHPFPAHYHGLAKRTFNELSNAMDFSKKIVFKNSWLFSGIIKKVLSKRNTTNALIRTTAATTLFSAGETENVLPHKASALINFRLIPGDSIQDIVPYLKKTIKNPNVKINLKGEAVNASPIARKRSMGYRAIAKSCNEIFPTAVVAPLLVIGATDSRHFNLTSKTILRFIPLHFTNADLETVHGFDEGIEIKNYHNMIRFYIRLFQNLNE